MIFQATSSKIELPNDSFITNSQLHRQGHDLIINNGEQSLTIEGYYSAADAPLLTSPNGLSLTPKLVSSFTQDNATFADLEPASGTESPVGTINEIQGHATVTRTDGSTITLQQGTPIYQGDIVETQANGAVNIVFIDETSFAISQEAKLAIDEFVFDPETNAGTTDFSALKGVFVYTSGLIGREDPDDVNIETPSGSIGIRGTIIAGNVDNGEVTVVEGAIVLNDFNGNEVTLSSQYETARFDSMNGKIEAMGQDNAQNVASRFSSVSGVAPDLFSSINDSAGENAPQDQGEQQGQDAQGESGQEQQNDQETQESQDGQDQQTQEAAPQEQQETEQQQQDQNEANNQQETEAAESNGDSQTGTEDQQAAQDDAAQATANNNGQNTQTGTEQATTQQTTQTATQQTTAQQNVVSQTTVNTLGTDAGQALGETALGQSLGTNAGTIGTTTTKTTLTTQAINTQVLQARIKALNEEATDETETPPAAFDVDITNYAIQEGTGGTVIATLEGVNGTISSLSLLGMAANYFTVQDNGDGTWNVRAATDINFDHEQGSSIIIRYSTTVSGSADGTTSDTGNITVLVSDVNESVKQKNVFSTSNAVLSGTDVSYSWNFANDFKDPEHQTITYEISNITIYADTNNDGSLESNTYSSLSDSALIDSYTFINGVLTIDLVDNTTLAQTSYLTFTLTASDDAFTGDNSTDDSETYTLMIADTYKSGNSYNISLMSGTDSAQNYIGSTADNTINIGSSVYNIYYDAQAGNDIITVSGENNVVIGGLGDDTFHITGEYIYADGGIGNNTFYISGDNNFIYGGTENDTIDIYATASGNTIKTYAGNDIVNIYGGSTGANIISTGIGEDTVTLYGSSAKLNIISTGEGNDSIFIEDSSGSPGNNTIYANAGDDEFYINVDTNNNELYGNEGDDFFNIQYLNANEFYGGIDNDTFKLNLSSNDDLLTEINTNGLVLDGGEGIDTIELYGDGSCGGTTPANNKLDFTSIDYTQKPHAQIYSIDRIDMETDASTSHTVVLRTSDVFEITDDTARTLIIDGTDITGYEDYLNFTNDSNLTFTKTATGVEVNENTGAIITNGTGDGDLFDVYTNGEVTLIIDQDVVINTGAFPGT